MSQHLDSSDEHVEPLTEAQLTLVNGWIKHTAKVTADRVSRRALAGFAILLAGLAFAITTNSHDASSARKATVVSGRAVAVDGCNRDFRDKDDFRGLLVRLKVANDASFQTVQKGFNAGKVPLATFNQSVRAHNAATKFYTDSLADQKYPNCGAARSIVTDDPSKTIVVPRPLTRDDAKNADLKAAAERIAKGG